MQNELMDIENNFIDLIKETIETLKHVNCSEDVNFLNDRLFWHYFL